MLMRRPEFPGMDPWLEHPTLWPDLHNSLIGAIRQVLSDLLAPRYFVGVEQRAYIWSQGDLVLLGLPDAQIAGPIPGREFPRDEGYGGVAVAADPDVRVVELDFDRPLPVEETFLQIVDTRRRRVVTVLEVLSPSNKQQARGRKDYLAKRRRILASRTGLVEIDLMRAGTPLPHYRPDHPSDYRILVRRGRTRTKYTLYEFSYKAAIPAIPVPLIPDDPEPTLDLNAVLHGLLDRARYYLVTDYGNPPSPPLRPADAAWAAAIVARAEGPEGGRDA